jgi:hypothetical protein
LQKDVTLQNSVTLPNGQILTTASGNLLSVGSPIPWSGLTGQPLFYPADLSNTSNSLPFANISGVPSFALASSLSGLVSSAQLTSSLSNYVLGTALTSVLSTYQQTASMSPYLTNAGGWTVSGSGTVAGAFVATNSNSLIPYETRIEQVSYIKGAPLPASLSVTLFSSTSGPGNVDFLQISSLGTRAVNVRITVDGVQQPDIPLEDFLCAINTSAVVPMFTFITDDFALTENEATGVTGYRRIFIPFNASCSVVLVNNSAVTTYYWTQVQYRIGAIPWAVYGPYKRVFHVQYNPPVSIATTSPTILPTVTGSGVIEGINFNVIQQGSGGPNYDGWMETKPTINTDGINFIYGGTEDFFGTNFYGQYTIGKQSNYAGIVFNSQITIAGTTYNAANSFRIFKPDPIIFNNYVSFQWNSTAANTTVSSLVYYYTTN